MNQNINIVNKSLPCPTNGDISRYLCDIIPKYQMDLVFRGNASMEIYPEFMGFVDIYFYLSKTIPKDWTIIDIGCGYNAQSFLFKDHKKVIAINPFNSDEIDAMFVSPNCEIFKVSGKEFIENELPKLGLNLDKTFAILNYVPEWCGGINEIVRTTFKNLYVFYPK
jgi:hypothetical protein